MGWRDRSLMAMGTLVIGAVLGVSGPASGGALHEMSGDLEAFLKGIDYGRAGDDAWVEPDAWRLARFDAVFDLFLRREFARAQRLAAKIGYEVVEYTDTEGDPPRTHYILRETARAPDPRFTGGGTYLLYPPGHNLFLQAPHPVYDRYTGEQAVETYLSVGARLLALPGTRRDSATAPSPCTGDYPESDAAHNTQHLFFRAHERASLRDPATVTIQLHGFGSDSLSRLQGQCGSTNSLLVNLSEGRAYAPHPTAPTFLQILEGKIQAGGAVTPCVYGADTSILGGTWNVEGRFSNGAEDACLEDASTSSGRFIHLEQSFLVRSAHREEMASYIAQAVADYFR
jgi:hypothetical protein